MRKFVISIAATFCLVLSNFSALPAQAMAELNAAAVSLPVSKKFDFKSISTAANWSKAASDETLIVTYPDLAESSLPSAHELILDGPKENVSLMSKADALSFASSAPGVSIETNQRIHAATTQTSPDWGLDRIDEHQRTLDSQYKYSTTGQGVRIYVVDTGIYAGHNDLAGRVLPGAWSPYVGYSPDDCNGHGTSVASLAAGTSYGVAKSAQVFPLRILDCNGSGYGFLVVQAMEFIISHHPGGPAVINMSLGTPYSSSINAAVNLAASYGFLVVTAAGNDAANACYTSPGSAIGAINVGATDSNDSFAYFSDYGPCVDVLAPGVNLRSASKLGPNMSTVGSGTSFSSPLVAGVLARALQLDTTLNVSKARTWLAATGTNNAISGLYGGTPNSLVYANPSWFLNTPVPTISGRAEVGQVIQANTGAWDAGVSLTFQWNRNGTPISGATSQAYVLAGLDATTNVSVTVTGVRGGETNSQTSASVQIALGTLITSSVPVITGSAAVGQTLGVDVSQFPAGTAFTYQWYSAGSALPGATLGSYLVTANELGKAISLTARVSELGYYPIDISSPSTAVVARGTFLASPNPKISGTIAALETVTADTSGWEPETTFTYEWSIDGSMLGENSSSLLLTQSDVGKWLNLKVTATKLGYNSVTVSIDTPLQVAMPKIKVVGAPRVTGTLKVGKILKASPGTWMGGVTLTYQWLRNGKPVPGATNSTYKLTKKDKGKVIQVRVSAAMSGYSPASSSSAKTKKVK